MYCVEGRFLFLRGSVLWIYNIDAILYKLIFDSLYSTGLLIFVLIESLYAASLTEKMLHHYKEEVKKSSLQPIEPITQNLLYFPPTKTVALLVLKTTGI